MNVAVLKADWAKTSFAAAAHAHPIRVVTGISGAEWDRLVAGFADACYEQTQALRGALWPEHRLSRVAVMSGSEVIGLALATVIEIGLVKRGVAHVRFGPLWRRKDRAASESDFALVVDALIAEFVTRRRLCLILLPQADPRFAGFVREVLLARGFGQRPLDDANRYLVDASLDEPGQLTSLGMKWRYNLKQAFKQNIAVAEEPGEAALDALDGLFREMEERKNYVSDSWSSAYPKIRAGLPGVIRPMVILAREAGIPVAGAVVAAIGDTAYYVYGATSARAIKIRAGYALHWRVLALLRGQGIKWYELGGDALDEGMRHFKTGFVGKSGAIAPLIGEFALCHDSVSALIDRAMIWARVARSRAHTPLGKRLLKRLRAVRN